MDGNTERRREKKGNGPTTHVKTRMLCGGGVPSSHPSLGLSVFFLSFSDAHLSWSVEMTSLFIYLQRRAAVRCWGALSLSPPPWNRRGSFFLLYARRSPPKASRSLADPPHGSTRFCFRLGFLTDMRDVRNAVGPIRDRRTEASWPPCPGWGAPSLVARPAAVSSRCRPPCPAVAAQSPRAAQSWRHPSTPRRTRPPSLHKRGRAAPPRLALAARCSGWPPKPTRASVTPPRESS